MAFYFRLFNGLHGSSDPFVGPLGGITWIGGELRIFDQNWKKSEFLYKKIKNGELYHDGIYYHHMDIIHIEGLEEANEMKDAISFETFFNR